MELDWNYNLHKKRILLQPILNSNKLLRSWIHFLRLMVSKGTILDLLWSFFWIACVNCDIQVNILVVISRKIIKKVRRADLLKFTKS